MGYRLKANPSHLYDVFIHLRRRQDETVASVVRFYPDTYVDEDLFASVVKFAFPSVPQTTPPFHHSPSSTPPTYPPSHFHSESHDYHRPSKKFTFVLTNIESKFRFGFCCSFYQDCGHDSDTVTDPDNHPKDHDNDDKRSSHGDDVGRGVVETCYCFISYLPYFSLFNKALDILRHTLTIHFPLHHPLNFLCKLHDVSNFGQSQAISFEVDAKEYQFVCSIYESLQQIPENINLTIMHKSFTTKNLIFLFASLLFERRTLLYSACIEKLSACVLGVVLLMNPMIWQHLFIPILPPSLIDYCSAPMPYVIGMHESTFKSLNPSDYSDAVVVDIDRQVVLTEHNDLELIPRDVISSLKKDLKKASLKPYDDVISRAFLNAMVKLIGSYRNALRFRVGESITFDPESFVLGGGPCGAETGGASVSSLATQYKIFFSAVIQFQCFQQFIQGRLDMLNSGGGFQDQFEYECSLLGEDRWKTQSRYKDWASHMKNRGKVLKKEGKDKWSVFAKKVKKKSKQTWKDVKSKIEEIKKDEENQSTFHLSQSKPPPRPPPPNLIRDSLNQLKNPTERIQHYHLLDPEKLNISQHCNNRDEDDDDDDDDIDDLDDDTFIHKITEFDFDPSFKNFLNNSSNNNYVRMNKKHNNDDDVSKGVGIVRTHFKRAFYEGDDDEDEDDDDDDDDVNIESEAKMRKSHSIEGLVKRDNNDNNTDNDVNNNNDLIKIEGSLPTSPQRMLGADVNKKAKVKSQSSLDLNQLLSPNGISTIETIFHHHQQPHFLPHLHHQDHHQDYHHHHRAVKSYAEVDVTNKQSQQQKQQLQQQQQQLAQQQKQQQQSQLQQKQPKEQQQPHMKQSQSRDLITLDTLETDSVEFDPLKLPAKTATATGVISLSNTATSATATSTTATSTTATLAIATTSLSSSTITLRPLSTTILRPSSATTILRPPSTTTTTTTQSTPVPFPRNSRSPIQSSNLFNPPPTTEAAPSSPQPPLPFPRKNSSVYLQYYQTKKDFPLSSTSGFSSQPSVTTTTATRKMSATTVATTVAVPKTTTATNNAKIPHTAPKAQPVFGSLLKMKPKNSAAISVKATPAAVTTATTIATSNQRKLAFIQSDCNLQLPPPNFHLFDPIATGQLILDPPLSSTSSHHSKSDEQLLKEWNLLDINIATEATPQPHSPLMRSHNEHQASIHANHSLPNLFKSISPQPLQLPQQQSQLQPQPLQPQLLQPQQQQQQQINKEDLLSLYSKPPPQSPFHRRNIFQNNAASFNANYNNNNPNIINSNINSNSNNFNINNSNNNNFNINNSNINNSNNNKQVPPRSSTLPQRSTLFGHLTKQPTNHPRQVSHNDNNDNNSFINTSNININTKNNNINNNICLNSNKNILTSNTVSSRTSSLRTENAYTSLNQNKTWEKFE